MPFKLGQSIDKWKLSDELIYALSILFSEEKPNLKLIPEHKSGKLSIVWTSVSESSVLINKKSSNNLGVYRGVKFAL